MEALILANARETFTEFDPLPGTAVCTDLKDLEQHLCRPAEPRSAGSPKPPAWLLRASLCSAGRARTVAESPTEQALMFGERHLRLGPVHLAPVVDIVAEYALHGWLGRSGSLACGVPVRTTQSGGTWRGAERATGLSKRLGTKLVDALGAVAERLHDLGYFGPFGIDAFEWEDASGSLRLHAPSEVNARYTMTYALGAPNLIEFDHG